MALLPRFSLFLAALGILTSCASPPPPLPPVAVTPPHWSFERDAIRLHLVADQHLNLFHKTPHALVTCLYQLRDPNAFNQAAGEPNGVAKLLECGRFDPSVAGAKRVVIQPKQELEESLDRAEGARYLGYVAGYYGSRSASSVYLTTIPVAQQEISKTQKALKPARVTLDLLLGPSGIVAGEKDAKTAAQESR